MIGLEYLFLSTWTTKLGQYLDVIMVICVGTRSRVKWSLSSSWTLFRRWCLGDLEEGRAICRIPSEVSVFCGATRSSKRVRRPGRGKGSSYV